MFSCQSKRNTNKDCLVIVIGFTENAQLLAHDLLEFFDIITIDLPSPQERKSILRRCLREFLPNNQHLQTEQNLECLVRVTDGFNRQNCLIQ